MRSKIPILAAGGWLSPDAWVLQLTCPSSQTPAGQPVLRLALRAGAKGMIDVHNFNIFFSFLGSTFIFVLSLARWLQSRNSLASRFLSGVDKSDLPSVLRTSYCHGQKRLTLGTGPSGRHFQAKSPLPYESLLLLYKNIFSENAARSTQHYNTTRKRTALYPSCSCQVVCDPARSGRRNSKAA